jgi:uncharacterized protein
MKFISRRASRFRLEVRRSRIHRRGVFAAEPIPAHRRVIEYTGERITQKETIARYARMCKRGKAKLTYLFHLRRNCVIDGSVGGSGAEIINHSCRPNLITRTTRNHIYYASRRAIPAGTELTVDYRFSKTAIKVRCRCGSPNCRGTINLLK